MIPQPISLRCSKCEHQWSDNISSDCSVGLTVASMDDLVRRGCPACGAKTKDTVMIRTDTAAVIKRGLTSELTSDK